MRTFSNIEKRNIIIAAIVVFFLLVQFGLKPYLHRRTATQVVETVLTQWSNKDLLRAIDQWENQEDYPPVYSVTSYEITKREFYKEKGRPYAKFQVYLEFSASNVLPSHKEWVFILRDSKLGWKVFDFYLAEDESFEWEKIERPLI